MPDRILYALFKKGSRTYFTSSLFFPKKIREEVFILYGFVRKADNFVDTLPQQAEAFYKFKRGYEQALSGRKSGDIVIDGFVELMARKKFERSWVDAFIRAMEWDLTKKTYCTLADTQEYMYGSAEVIGLMMSRILGLDPKADEYAKHLGRAMQYINFIRDIAEDLTLGRTYLPEEDLSKHGLASLEKEMAEKNQEKFRAFIKEQIARYFDWQKRAEEGYRFMPKRYLIPVKTAADMYKWTAGTIGRDPLVIYRRKVKPSLLRIASSAIYNTACL